MVASSQCRCCKHTRVAVLAHGPCECGACNPGTSLVGSHSRQDPAFDRHKVVLVSAQARCLTFAHTLFAVAAQGPCECGACNPGDSVVGSHSRQDPVQDFSCSGRGSDAGDDALLLAIRLLCTADGVLICCECDLVLCAAWIPLCNPWCSVL